MKLTSVHHIAVINSNYEKSYDFYVNRLGLKVIFDIERPAKNDRVLMLELDQGLMLEVFIMENPPKHLDAPEAAGLRHLAFGVESVPEAIKWLNSRGIETGPILMDTNNNINKPVVFFWDPDGTPLELGVGSSYIAIAPLTSTVEWE